MKNFKYEVNTYMDGEEVILRTNNPRNAIHAFFEALEIHAHVNIVDGTTGEVLAIANCPDMDNYTTDEMALMMLGYLMEAEWGHAEAEEAECVDCEDEDSDLPTCGLCGGDVVNGVCNCCGRRVEPYVERVPDIGEVMVALVKQMADELGVETIPLPGRNLDVSPCLLPIPKGLPS